MSAQGWAVFVPKEIEGMVSGWDMIHVNALDERDAIAVACRDWFGTRHVQEGAYVVAKTEDLKSFEVESGVFPDIQNEFSLPFSNA